MARQNIFDLITQRTDIEREINHIIRLFEEEKTITAGYNYSRRQLTIREFLDVGPFAGWVGRGHSIDLDEFLELLEYDDLQNQALHSECAFTTLMEIVYNLWCVADDAREEFSSVEVGNNFFLLQRILVDCISQFNLRLVHDKKNAQYILIEDRPEVTAVAEIVDDALAFDVLWYNHRTLKGNLKEKKRILFSLGQNLEINRKQLQVINTQLTDAIFTILNNMGIRHNNPHNEEVLANLTQGELEEWYDELYQMMLLAKLELDNIERMNKYKTDLKPKLI